MKFGMLPWTVCLLKVMLNFFSVSSIQGRELNFSDYKKYIKIDWRVNA